MTMKVYYNPLKAGPRPLAEGSDNMWIGMASVVLGDAWRVENIKVCKRPDGSVFAGLQRYKNVKDEWVDVAHPVNKEAHDEWVKALTEAVENYTPAAE